MLTVNYLRKLVIFLDLKNCHLISQTEFEMRFKRKITMMVCGNNERHN